MLRVETLRGWQQPPRTHRLQLPVLRQIPATNLLARQASPPDPVSTISRDTVGAQVLPSFRDQEPSEILPYLWMRLMSFS